ncbi:MAG: heme o synthase [Myxococcota bacterium]
MSLVDTGMTASEPIEAPRTMAETLRLYVDITRPKVMALVVFTGLPALFLGKDVFPTPALAFWVLVGTAMAGGASSAFNAYIERDTDAFMARTRNRPLPAATVVPWAVLGWGAFLTVASSLVLFAVGGWTPVGVSLATIVFYVFAYTIYLKPRTPQNIVIGGAAGGTAPLIASAAVDGSISVGAWILFAIIFLWTPPHFWAIAIVRKKEYAAAGLPMMPLVIGDQATRRQSLVYTVLLVAVSLLPVALGYLGSLYAILALALGLWFTGTVVQSLRQQDPTVDWGVFKASIAYLSFLFFTMLADIAIPWGTP